MPTKNKLVIFVPGITMNTAQWEPLVNTLKKESDFEDYEWLGWNHNCGIFSTSDVIKKASDLNSVITAKWRQSNGFDEVVLVGHSFGGILVRTAYLLGSGCYEGEPTVPWVNYVKRFVLLAAINRGLDQSSFKVRLYDLVTRVAGLLTFNIKRFLGQDFISGSEFITDLRMRWIRHMHSLSNDKRPSVSQILGTKDSVVTRKDSIDLEQFPNAVHITIPDADHHILPLVNVGPSREYRLQTIHDCILGVEVESKDTPLYSEKTDNVVFILHGIRAANKGWVQELAEIIKKKLPGSEVVTPSYGYLSALEFTLPFLHRRPIRSFQHLYSDYYTQNPKAKFHFIGHSNGTYVLGHSLLSLPSMNFKHVSLAGSVLPRNFPWKELMKGVDPQVQYLRNDCSNTDIPVSFLCSGLKGLGRKDIGTGGYDGFFHDDNNVDQYWYHNGGHGAALQTSNLNSIAEFILDNEENERPVELVKEKSYVSFISRFAPWIFRLVTLSLISLLLVGLIQSNIVLLLSVGAIMILLAILLKTF